MNHNHGYGTQRTSVLRRTAIVIWVVAALVLITAIFLPGFVPVAEFAAWLIGALGIFGIVIALLVWRRADPAYAIDPNDQAA